MEASLSTDNNVNDNQDDGGNELELNVDSTNSNDHQVKHQQQQQQQQHHHHQQQQQQQHQHQHLQIDRRRNVVESDDDNDDDDDDDEESEELAIRSRSSSARNSDGGAMSSSSILQSQGKLSSIIDHLLGQTSKVNSKLADVEETDNIAMVSKDSTPSDDEVEEIMEYKEHLEKSQEHHDIHFQDPFKLASSANRRKHQRPQHVSVSSGQLADSIKSERLTPEEPVHVSSPSISPSRRRQIMSQGFPAGLSFMLGLRSSGPMGRLGHLSPTPSPGTSPSAPSSGPGAFSPAQLKHMEMMMSNNRNYSEYMRSLAAKYNSNANDCFPSSSPFSPPTPPVRPPVPRSPECPPSPASRPALGLHLSPRAAVERHPSPQRSPPTSFSLADFSSSQTLLNLVRTHAQSSQLETYLKGAVKRSASSTHEGDPLDLSLSGPPTKHIRSPSLSPASPKEHQSFLALQQDDRADSRPTRCSSAGCPNREHQSKFLARWSVDDVVNFVQSIDVCAPYAEKFRDQSIDGSILSVLTEDHLTAYMGMRLGPAIKLRQGLANMTGHCSVCLHCLHCRGPPKSPLASNTRASSTNPSPHSSHTASPKNLDLLEGQPTPASSSPSPPPSHASSPTDIATSN